MYREKGPKISFNEQKWAGQKVGHEHCRPVKLTFAETGVQNRWLKMSWYLHKALTVAAR